MSLPRIIFPEYQDDRVAEAIKEAEKRGIIEAIYPEEENTSDLYTLSVDKIINDKADILISGACAPKKEIINKILDHKGTKLTSRLFTIAPLELNISSHDRVYMIDPIIKTKKTSLGLKGVILDSIKVFKEIEKRSPKVALITNNEYEEDSEKIFQDVTKNHKEELSEYLYPAPVQLDVALDKSIRKFKLGIDIDDADILVFDDLTTANVFYKSVSLLSNSVCGTLMCGLNKGIYGLVSRGADKEELLRLISITAKRFSVNKQIE